jgi:hypothetical protein
MDANGPKLSGKTEPAKYAEWISLLRDDSAYLRQAPAPAYWALAPYYVGQYTECACSLASAVMVVNAARADRARGAGSRLITQQALLDAVGSDDWRDEVGHDDGQGVGLAHLATLLGAGLKAVGAPAAEIQTVPLRQGTEADLAAFRRVLRDGEAGPGRFIIANYYMATVIGDGDYGHFSPVGAYDAARDRVLILDVYRVELEPYWVPVERLFAGMATVSRADGEPRGYLAIRLSDRP